MESRQAAEVVTGSELVKGWPDEAREAAELVLQKYGEPHEATESYLIWHRVGPWKRLIASRTFYRHEFPTPHIDAIESVIDYRVPADKAGDVMRFDGSVVVERTAGEVSARCHDEEANSLALNLMHDIVVGARTALEARDYYAREFLDYRRKLPTPYMDGLRFEPNADAADPDTPVLSEADLQRAREEGERRT
jgi:hypothetical protein